MNPFVEQMAADIIKTEGGFSNNVHDKGKATKYGITQVTLGHWLKRPATLEDVFNLDVATAEEIYKANYYYGPRINTLPDALEPQVFDEAINHGPGTAIRLLQEVCTICGYECDIDGVLGPQSVGTVTQAYAALGPYLINAISERRELFYHTIVLHDPSQEVFLSGWLKRAQSFRVAIQ